MSQDPRSGDEPDDERRRQPPERNTEPIPTYSSGRYSDIEFEEGEYVGGEYAVLDANQAGVGYDRVDYVATRDASDLVRRYLFPTEKFRGEWRRHWIHLVKRLGIGVLATFVLGYLAGYFAKQNVTSALTILSLIHI